MLFALRICFYSFLVLIYQHPGLKALLVSDYEVRVFYTEPDAGLIGKKVHGGDRIGVHVGVRCDGCYGPGMIEHAHFQMYKYSDIGVAEIIDGTSFVLCV